MSTLSLRKIKHDSSSVDNITLNSNGTTTANAEVIVPSLKGTSGNKLQLRSGDSSYGVSLQNISGIDLLTVDAVGRVTMPYQPAFQVRLSGNQSFSGNTRTKINFNTIDYETGSNYNTSLQRFTAPVTGWYQFNSWAYGYTVSNNELMLYKNGSIYLRSQWAVPSSINNVNSHLSAVTKLTAGDYVEMWCALNPGGDLYHSGDRPTVWSGILIG